MAHRSNPSQDPAEGARDIVDHEIERGKTERKNQTGKPQKRKPEEGAEAEFAGSGEKIAVPTPLEPGDQNAQTTSP